MPERRLVSVVMATYNMAAYLPLAVRSALEQTYQDVEVLIVDDGSTDGTRGIVGPLLEDRRVKYLYQENKGQAAAKNHGIREARGEYIAFLDADDVWVREKLEQQIPLFLRSPAVGVVYSKLTFINEAGEETGISDYELFRGRVSGPLLISNFVGFGTSVVRRRCFERLGIFDESMKMGIDYDLWLRFSTEFEFDYVDRPLLRYRVWSGQMSNNCRGRYLSGIATMRRFLQKFPDVVGKSTVREAWAHTYVGYGQCVLELERRAAPALPHFVRALGYKPTYLPAWKAILKAILGLR